MIITPSWTRNSLSVTLRPPRARNPRATRAGIRRRVRKITSHLGRWDLHHPLEGEDRGLVVRPRAAAGASGAVPDPVRVRLADPLDRELETDLVPPALLVLHGDDL